MTVTPLHDRLIIRRLEDGDHTVGGIIIPDSAKEKPQPSTAGRQEGRRDPVWEVLGPEIKIDGDEYPIMREDDVLAIIDGK